MNKGETKNILKRILSLFIINIMLISLFAPYSVVFATQKSEVSLIIPDTITSIKDKDIVPINIMINGGYPVVKIDGNLVFESNEFEFQSIVVNPDLGQDGNPTYQESDGYIYIGSQSPCINTHFATINLRAKKDLTSFTIKIEGCYTTWEDGTTSENLGTVTGEINLSSTPTPPAQTYTVTYDYSTNGGDSATKATADVAENDPIDLTQTATKTDYTFIGWNTNQNATVGLTPTDESAVMGTQPVTLYAIFKRDNVQIATCNYYDSTGNPQSVQLTGTLYNNDTTAQITLPSSNENYIADGKTWTRKGWTTQTQANTSDIKAQGSVQTASLNTIYYMVYERDITVTYNTNGGTISPTNPTGLKATVNSSAIGSISGSTLTITSTIPVRTGYEFQNAWTTNQDGTGDPYASNTQYTFTDDCILYAKWDANTYVVKYDGNGNDTTNTPMSDTSYVYGNNGAAGVALNANTYTKQGYTFKGWATSNSATTATYTDGSTILNADIIANSNNNKEITLYAVWEENGYNITYSSNPAGMTLPSENPNTYRITDGTITLINPSVPGYTFLGWTDNNGTSIAQENYQINNLTQDIEITAQFSANTYTVKYDGNGNDTTNTTPMPDTSYIYGNNGATGVTLSANTYYTKAGYTFKGWATNNTATAAVYQDAGQIPNEDIIENANDTNEVILYAVWEANANIPYTVEHYLPNTDGTYPEAPTQTENLVGTTGAQATATAQTTAAYIGYVVDENNSNTKTTGTITADGNLVLKLYYKVANYTVTFDVNGGAALSDNTKTVTYGAAYGSMPTPVYTGHTFLGWFDSQTGGNKITGADLVTQTKNHTLYAHWEITKYKVDFIGKVNDGSAEGTNGVLKSVQVNHGDNIIPGVLGIDVQALKATVTTPKYTYTVDESNPFKINNENVSLGDLQVTQNIEIYINYISTINQYTVSFYEEGADPEADNALATESVDYGGSVTGSAANPNRQPDSTNIYQFLKWVNADGTDASLNNITEDKNVFASYTPIPRYHTVTFFDEDKVTVLGTATVDYDGTATSPIVANKQDGVGYEYTFDKWVVDLDANPQVEDDLSNVTADRNVYATYTKSPIQYKIKYEGTQDAPNPNPLNYTVESQDITLAPLGQKVGMTFVGWYTDTTYTTPITSIKISEMDNTNLSDITIYAKWDIESLMYFVKDSSQDDNSTLAEDRIYDNFDDAKAYVDTLFDEGRGTALGIYDLNNDLVYFPEVEEKLYYIKDSANIDNETLAQDKIYDDFDLAKQYVDDLFAQGTTTRIYDKNNKLVYEPKEETPKVQYFVKVNADDPNTDENTFDMFSDAKIFANQNVANKVKVYDINGEIVYEPQEKLYLRTRTYKIGENTLDEYEDGDLYLYRINPNTTFANFKISPNCITNGTITVYKQDGTILGDNELVGTGMTLKDELNGQEITLTISVIGDTDGDGTVTAADLADTVQKTIGDLKFNMAQFKAIDMDEDHEITAADLADEIKLSLM